MTDVVYRAVLLDALEDVTAAAADTARHALAKASLIDPRVRRNDPAVLAAWAEILAGVTPGEACDAVTAYYSEARERVILPGDVVSWVRAIRRRTQRPDQGDIGAALADIARIADRPGDPVRIAAAKDAVAELLTSRAGRRALQETLPTKDTPA